jgi:hypothetical protein
MKCWQDGTYYDSEALTNRKQEEWRLTSAEIKLLRKTNGCIRLDHKINELITEEL